MSIGELLGQFNGLFAGHVFNVEAQQQHVVQRLVNLMLQPRLVVGRIAAAQQAQSLHFLVGILNHLDAAEGNLGHRSQVSAGT